jgi:transposase
MGRHSHKAKLDLSSEEIEFLQKTSNSKVMPYREVNRAKILFAYASGKTISLIKQETGISRETIYEYVDRALNIGVKEALRDMYHRPKEPVITQEAKLWVISIACTKPKEHGYAAEMWSYNKLAEHVRKQSIISGHECLIKAGKATVYRILDEAKIKPHRIKYYLERRDERFEEKMEEVLCVYKEVSIQNEKSEKGEKLDIITLSVDEKPGIQAIKNIAPDLTPALGLRSTLRRDYEYKRLGTLSLLAALDLHTGQVIAQVHDRHRSIEFISLLKEIDSIYPKDSKIRIILDNHSAHRSKETMKYLSSVPNRFVYVHTPKHGSWLNLVEMLFSKMARTFLKQIRVDTKSELKARIMKGIEEINEAPVIYRWKNFDPNMSMF